MNICVLIGKIISEIEFKFVINSKNKSIVYFDIELQNKNVVKAVAYDDKADYIYRKIKNKNVLIEGQLRDNYIEIQYIEEI